MNNPIDMENINDKIDTFLDYSKTLAEELKVYGDELKKKRKIYELADSLKFMEGDYVWILSVRQVHTQTNMLKIEHVHIEARAKINDIDGTDNRLQLTAEDLLEIRQEYISSILYGNPSSSYFDRNESSKKWWYRGGMYNVDFFDDELIGTTKEELINRWRKRFESLRDAYFLNYWKIKAEEKQRKIDDTSTSWRAINQ